MFLIVKSKTFGVINLQITFNFLICNLTINIKVKKKLRLYIKLTVVKKPFNQRKYLTMEGPL